MAGGLQTVQFVQFGDVVEVEFLEQPLDAVLAAGALLDEAKPGAHQISGAPHLRADHVSLGDQVGVEEHGEHLGIDLVGLDLSGGDGFQPGGVGQAQLHALGLEEVGEPVPAAGRFDDRLVGPRELTEVALDEHGTIRYALLFDDLAVGAVGCDEAIPLVLVDP